MRLVLDSNEYIVAFGVAESTASKSLIEYFLENPTKHNISICRTIINEVQRNLTAHYLKEYFDFIWGLATIEEDYAVPIKLGIKYGGYGLKSGNAFIASYAEYVRADLLVSENRHFLSRRSDLPFRVVNADECLKQFRHLQ